MQLVAYGAQDIYLTGNPQITFFKVVYRRHTNFSMETIEQTLNGASTATTDSTSTCTISRNGDLVYKIYVSNTVGTATTNGSVLVKEVELEIGGQRIDKHTSEWMNVWTELSTPDSKAIGLKSMQCDIGTQGSTGVNMTQIPLQFWFCRNPGLALPLIALQYHEVKLKFTWDGTAAGDPTAKPLVWCDYIYLDTDERRRFAQVSHEYLIEQIQEQTMTTDSGDKKLNFNHPVKELIWVMASRVDDTTYQLKLNGHDRFAAQEDEYFQLRQPFDYHTAVPAQNLPTNAYSSVRGTSTYENITTGGQLLAIAQSDAVDLTDAGWSPVLSGSSGSIFVAGNEVEPASTTPTRFIAVGGGAGAGDFGLNKKSVAIGDIHLVQVGDQSDTAAVKTTLAKVVAVYNDNAGSDTTLDDGTGVFVSPSGGAADVSDSWSGSTKKLGANSIAILYDKDVTTTTAVAANDPLSIIKIADAGCRTSQMTKRINVYSFALKPEEHQPSGTCNFSRIDNAQLNVSSDNGAGTIYAVNYNVLRIMSGMGGLAYSN